MTPGQISISAIEAVLTLPKKYQTSILRFLAAADPHRVTGDGILMALLEHVAAEGTRAVGIDAVRGALAVLRNTRGNPGRSIAENVLWEIEFAPERYHTPLLELAVAARPLGNMSLEDVVIAVWRHAYDSTSRSLSAKDVGWITVAFTLGPDYDDLLLRFFEDPRSSYVDILNRDTMKRLKEHTLAKLEREEESARAATGGADISGDARA